MGALFFKTIIKNCCGCSLAIILAFALGCKQNPMTQQSAVVSGIVKLYNDTGNSVPAGGVLVSVSAISQTVQTNDTGFWQITGIPEGTYTFSFTKQGFGTMKVYEVKAKGKDTVADIYLSEPATEQVNFQTFIVGLSVQDSSPYYFVQGQVQQPILILQLPHLFYRLLHTPIKRAMMEVLTGIRIRIHPYN
jgi:hypothetical protein